MDQKFLNTGSVVSDRYEIINEIAHTELSAVYLAQDKRLNRNVALKHVFKKKPTDDFTSLIREAHVLSTMSHANILTVYDCTNDDKGTYIISEYLDGQTLEQYVKDKEMSLREFVSIAKQMVLGLSEAHQQGVIHGDLKPNNIIILTRSDGRKQVKLLDFGLSRVTTGDVEDDGSSNMQGSAYFMSPEEFNGAPKSVSSDIYSMGCLCYYAVTGRYPFEGDNSMQIMAAHIQHKLHPPIFHRPDLDDLFNQWMMWMMNLNPDSRPASAEEALDTLRRCIAEIDEINRQKGVQKSMLATAPQQTVSGDAKLRTRDMGWIGLRNHAIRSLAKLVSKQQAAAFMVKTMEKHGYQKNQDVPRELWRLVITDYFAHNPNRSKQAAMLKETEKFFQQ